MRQRLRVQKELDHILASDRFRATRRLVRTVVANGQLSQEQVTPALAQTREELVHVEVRGGQVQLDQMIWLGEKLEQLDRVVPQAVVRQVQVGQRVVECHGREHLIHRFRGERALRQMYLSEKGDIGDATHLVVEQGVDEKGEATVLDLIAREVDQSKIRYDEIAAERSLMLLFGVVCQIRVKLVEEVALEI